MFAKLFKHEFLATWRPLATAVGVLVLMGCILLAFDLFQVPILGPLGRVLGTVCLVAIGIIVPILLAVNYWRTMYAAPGYFTHSLPVRGRTILAAKATYACLAVLVGVVVATVLAFVLPTWVASTHSGTTVSGMWQGFVTTLGTGHLWVVAAFGIVVLLCEYLETLCAITLGTRGQLGRLGAGGAIVAFVAMYLINQVAAVVSMVTIPWGLRLDTSAPDAQFTMTAHATDLSAVSGSGQSPAVVGLGWVPMLLVLAVIAVAWAVRSIERHTCLR
jgi:hypothetical protein